MPESLSEQSYRKQLNMLTGGGLPDTVETKMRAACQFPEPFFHAECWGFERRLDNRLLNLGVQTIYEMVRAPRANKAAQSFFGGQTAKRLVAFLAPHGLRLAMSDRDILDWIKQRLGGPEH